MILWTIDRYCRTVLRADSAKASIAVGVHVLGWVIRGNLQNVIYCIVLWSRYHAWLKRGRDQHGHHLSREAWDREYNSSEPQHCPGSWLPTLGSSLPAPSSLLQVSDLCILVDLLWPMKSAHFTAHTGYPMPCRYMPHMLSSLFKQKFKRFHS